MQRRSNAVGLSPRTARSPVTVPRRAETVMSSTRWRSCASNHPYEGHHEQDRQTGQNEAVRHRALYRALTETWSPKLSERAEHGNHEGWKPADEEQCARCSWAPRPIREDHQMRGKHDAAHRDNAADVWTNVANSQIVQQAHSGRDHATRRRNQDSTTADDPSRQHTAWVDVRPRREQPDYATIERLSRDAQDRSQAENGVGHGAHAEASCSRTASDRRCRSSRVGWVAGSRLEGAHDTARSHFQRLALMAGGAWQHRAWLRTRGRRFHEHRGATPTCRGSGTTAQTPHCSGLRSTPAGSG